MIAYFDFYIDNEFAERFSFNLSDPVAQNVFEIFEQQPKIYMVANKDLVPEIGSEYYGETSIEVQIDGQYGWDIYPVLTVDNIVKYVMYYKYEEQTEKMIAVLASNPEIRNINK